MSRVLVYLCSEPVIIVGDEMIALTKQQAQIADVLSRARGEWVEAEKIIGHCWQPDDEPGQPEKVIAVQIVHIRKKIENRGVLIESRYRGDYRMVAS